MEQDETLEHFGVKGMRWGVRKNRDSGASPDHARAKKVAKVAGAAALVGGAAVAVYALNKNGHLPVKHIDFSGMKISKANTSAFTKYDSPAMSRATSQVERNIQERVTRETMDAASRQMVHATISGREAMGKIKSEAWHKTVNDILTSLDEANASQDAWMRSMGLGHIVNNRVGLGR